MVVREVLYDRNELQRDKHYQLIQVSSAKIRLIQWVWFSECLLKIILWNDFNRKRNYEMKSGTYIFLILGGLGDAFCHVVNTSIEEELLLPHNTKKSMLKFKIQIQ